MNTICSCNMHFDDNYFIIHQAINNGKEALACHYYDNEYCEKKEVLYHLDTTDDKPFYDRQIVKIPDNYNIQMCGVYEWKAKRNEALKPYEWETITDENNNSYRTSPKICLVKNISRSNESK